MNEDYGLSSYFSKCRCCLEDFQGNNSWKINKFIRTQFLEFTSVNLSESERLPQHICLNCNSVLARFTTIKKSFVENQLKLESFIELGPNPSDYVTVVKEENEEPKEDTDPYPFVESIEPFTDHWEYNANPIFQPESTFATSIFVNQYLNPPATKKTPKKPKPDPVVKAAATPAAKTEKKPRKYKERPNLICEFCSKQFKMHSTFKAHIDRHYNYNKFVCDQCGNRSHSRADLLKHLFTHLQNDPRVTFRCDYENCEAVYRNKKSLYHHKKSFHLKERPFVCHFCAKTYAQRWMLTDHVKFTHQGQRPIQCDIEGCPSVFTTKGHLKRHKRKIHKILP